MLLEIPRFEQVAARVVSRDHTEIGILQAIYDDEAIIRFDDGSEMIVPLERVQVVGH